MSVFRLEMINFLQGVVVALIMTNAISVMVAWYALSLLRGRDPIERVFTWLDANKKKWGSE